MVGITKSKKEAEQSFHEALQDGETPEGLIIKVMRGDTKLGNRKITALMVQAARDLLPYRLPKLNAIDAQVKNVELTHEQWLAQLEDEDQADDGGGTE
jgi:hypothetical protein